MKKKIKDKIHDKVNNLGWLDILSLILCFWFLLYPHPYKIAFTAVLILPVLGLILNGVSRPSISSLVTITKESKYDLAEFIQLPAWVMLLRVLIDFEYESFYSLLKVGSIGFCILLLILVTTHKHINSSSKENWSIYLIIIGNIALFSYSATYGINCVFDNSEPKIYNVIVIDKHSSAGRRHTSYYLKVEPWGTKSEAEDISVTSGDYNLIDIGKTVEVDYRKGLFNIPWYYIQGEAEIEQKNNNRIHDSISLALKQYKADTNRVNEYYSLGYEFASTEDYDSSLYYASKALSLSDQLNFQLGRARAFSCMGIAQEGKKEYDSALMCHNYALDILNKLNYNKGLSSTYNNIAGVYMKKEKYDQALKNYVISLKLRERAGDKVDIGSSYINMGVLYLNQDNIKECLKNYLTAVTYLEQSNDKVALADLYKRLAEIYKGEKQTKEASLYFAKESALKKDTVMFKSN